MMCYASRTGTRRNLDALRNAGWGLLISRAGVWRTEGFTRIVGDNGAWADFQAGREFDEEEFERFLAWLAAQPVVPDWIVLPDIVAGGLASLSLSLRYVNRCLAVSPLVLIAVQDGMEHDDLLPHVGPKIGIFLGGSTEWKLARMRYWGEFCSAPGYYKFIAPNGEIGLKRCHYHGARINTARRFYQLIWAGGDSADGSSVSRYAVTLPNLDLARRHMDLFAPFSTSREG